MPQKSQPTMTQEWATILLNAKPKPSDNKKTSLVPAPTITAKDRKLENSTEAEKKELLPRNISVQLVAARVAHVPKISQKDLANQLNLPIKTIQEIEQHRHASDMGLAQRIARHLKIKLVK